MSRKPIEVRGNAEQPLGMPPARFLRDCWQKRPLLIRNAFPHFLPPISPEELAGLACEADALSRIVVHGNTRRKTRDSRPRGHDDRWEVRTGPFSESDFATLPESHWTLLVQDVDKWDGRVAALLTPFDFLPSWRIDDVMVSYAADRGGVGAHVDQYDVFLLQGEGRRRWRISDDPRAPQDFREDVELKLLRDFRPTHEWTLAPGDMLYLPPGVPHEGVAVGACTTFSIGMRAPSSAELLVAFAERIAAAWPESRRYADPDLKPARDTGEIDGDALRRARAALGPAASMMDEESFADFFGRFITAYRGADDGAPRKRGVRAEKIAAELPSRKFERNPRSRFAWRRAPRGAVLHVSGESYACPLPWARALCGRESAIDGSDLSALPSRDAGVTLLAKLLDAGVLFLRRC